jgi:multicomponent Na+:H+ antiporter subunit C
VNAAFAILAGGFLATSVYLLLSRSLIRMLLGLVILGNAVNLLILVAGRLTPIAAPILGAGAASRDGSVANPLLQALILTAIVIGFGLVTFMIVLVWRAMAVFGADDPDAMRLAEPESPPVGPADY